MTIDLSAHSVRDYVLIGLAVAAFAVGLVRQDMAVVTVGAGLLGTPALLGNQPVENQPETEHEPETGQSTEPDPVYDGYEQPDEPWEWTDGG